jgi:hypothetical protein
VVVAVILMRMVQASVHQIVDVIPVGNWRVPASRAVVMTRATPIRRRASVRILTANFDIVFIDLPIVQMMEVPVMEIIDVAAVPHRDVSAARSVDMRMRDVNRIMGSHGICLSWPELRVSNSDTPVLFRRHPQKLREGDGTTEALVPVLEMS